jgi:hypothetical protein
VTLIKHKRDNNAAALKAKIAIRRNVLNAVGLADNETVVFDAFAGGGEMHASVWKDADGYVGCDLKYLPDSRLMYCADNRRVLRAIDLMAFSIVDLDAWGNPWEQAIIIADRRPIRPAEKFGLVLTDGVGINYRMNRITTAVQILTGLKATFSGLSSRQDDVTNMAIAGLARRMHCSIINRWEAAGKTGAAMRYIGLVLRGD